MRKSRKAESDVLEVLGGRHVRAAQHLADGQSDDLQVEREAPVVHIPHVELEPVLEFEGMAALHRGPAGDARPYVVPAPLFWRVRVEVFREERPRSHEAHLAAEYIPQLSSSSRLVARRMRPRREIRCSSVMYQTSPRFGGRMVRNLHMVKGFSLSPRAFLAEEDRQSLRGRHRERGPREHG
jgi:hypothetical protein